MRVEGPGTEAGGDEATTVAFGTTRRPGRPRDPQADEAIISAIVDVLAEQGFSGFTVEEVAARAGVGKATIYRRWSTKEELVLAAAERVMVHVEPPDTGSLRDDLVGWYWEKFRTKEATTSDRLMGQVIVEAAVNPDLKKLLARSFKGRRQSIAAVVERAQARGGCGDIDLALLMDLISGTLMHRSLFGDKQLRRSDVVQVVDAALQGVGAGRC
jgi:AcrR family transcriptional regulator